MRPTYSMLLQHPWLASLSKPSTISEHDEDEAAAEADAAAEPSSNGEGAGEPNNSYREDGKPFATGENSYDEDVATWVKDAIEKKIRGAMASFAKPALHAAPFDSVSPAAVKSEDPMN